MLIPTYNVYTYMLCKFIPCKPTSKMPKKLLARDYIPCMLNRYCTNFPRIEYEGRPKLANSSTCISTRIVTAQLCTENWYWCVNITPDQG